MRHFVDLGTHYFEGLFEFIEKININSEWNIYCYEPNSEVYKRAFSDNYDKLKSRFTHFEFNNEAVTTYDGVIIFNQHNGATNDTVYDKNYDTGSNILDINPSYDPGNNVVFDIVKKECKCSNINRIIDSIVQNDNTAEIYIKCDIEGAEFNILPRLLESSSCSNIKAIYIEWHERFWLTVSETEYNKKIDEKKAILDGFKEKNITTFDHH